MYESKSVVKVLAERVESICVVEGRVGDAWWYVGRNFIMHCYYKESLVGLGIEGKYQGGHSVSIKINACSSGCAIWNLS